MSDVFGEVVHWCHDEPSHSINDKLKNFLVFGRVCGWFI